MLHGLDNQPIEVHVNDIDKLIPIKNHAHFSEIKTQVILKSWSGISCNHWLYVRETTTAIEQLIVEAQTSV